MNLKFNMVLCFATFCCFIPEKNAEKSYHKTLTHLNKNSFLMHNNLVENKICWWNG